MPRGARKCAMRMCGTASRPMTFFFAAMVSTTTRLTREEKGSSTQERRLKNIYRISAVASSGSFG